MILNARILPTIWYSNIEPKEGDSILIFAGIQNNSGKSFSGKVKFTIGGDEIKTVPFHSVSDEVSVVYAPWKVVSGTHYAKAEIISTDLSASTTLISNESSRDMIHISKVLSVENIKTDIGKVTGAVKNYGDGIAESAIEKLETFKPSEKETSSNKNNDTGTTDTHVPAVLGTSTQSTTDTLLTKGMIKGIDAVQFTLTHWIWLICVLLLSFFLWRIWRKKPSKNL